MYTTKTTLLLNVSNGDDVSWQDFYDNYRPLIISLASESGIPAADIDEIVQLTMLAIFNNGKFAYQREKHGKFRSWCGGIIRHKISDYFRSADHPLPETPDHDTIAIPADFEKLYLSEYRKFMLNAAINELKNSVTPEYFEAFQLCCLRNMADKDAATLLGEKSNTVTVRKKRSLAALRKIIEQINLSDPELDIEYL